MTSSAPTRIGLLVIHGIGQQRAGDTLKSVVEGIEIAYGGDRFTTTPDGDTTGRFQRVRDGVVEPIEVRVYEVYWADQLPPDKVRGSFDIVRLHQLVWFPFFNWRLVENFSDEYRRGHVLTWTAVLLPIAAVLTAAYHGLQAVLGFVQAIVRGFRESSLLARFAARFAQTPLIGSTLTAVQSDPDGRPRRTPLDEFLDEYVGDIFNYVDDAGEANPFVPKAAQQIYDVFHDALTRAVARDECAEIQILAHSLGSVITYHALTTHREQTEALVSLTALTGSRPPLTHVYTIGSPLEKFRFFWPKLIAGRPGPAEAQFEWHNFASPGDLVAGPLRTYRWVPKISNHRVAGAWGLFTAHTAYRRQPSFLRVFGPALTGEAIRRIRLSQRFGRISIAALFETVGIPASVVSLAAVGALATYWSFAILPAVLVLPIDTVQSSLGFHWTLPRTIAATTASFLGWLAIAVTFPVALVSGYRDGRRVHHEYWSTGFALERRTRPVDTSSSVYKDPRTYGILVGQVALLALIGWVGIHVGPGSAISRSNAWLIIMTLMAAFAVLAGRGITGYWRGILIDNRNKMSLGRLQLLAWTLVVLSALVTAGLTNGPFGAQAPLGIHVPQELWVLLGISTASAIAGPALVAPKREKNADAEELASTAKELFRVDGVVVKADAGKMLLTNSSKADARWGDLLKGDESGNAASVDVGKLQMFFFTFVLVLGYAVAIARLFDATGAITSLPVVDSSMNTLLGISHTGYLANKVVPHSLEQTTDDAGARAKTDGAETPQQPADKEELPS